jgi:hypothetical protein
LDYLPTRNGISVICEAHWTTSGDIALYSDASNKAIGGLCGKKWFYVPFVEDLRHLQNKSIAWRELYAVVTTVATFANILTGMRLMIFCDNQAIVQVLQAGSSKNPDIMKLVRLLFYICANYQLECSAVHLKGVVNQTADALSRLEIDRFFKLCPSAEHIMTKPKELRIH